MTQMSYDSVLLRVWHSLEQSLIDDVVDQWQMRLHASVPVADILNILCDYQFVSLYLMNFMFHTMLDAACNI